MKIVVLVKAVPMETEVRMTSERNIDREHVQLNVNIADESALEAALQLADRVTVLSMGTKPTGKLLSELIACGADEAVLLSDPAFAGADTYATARTLMRAIPEDVDYIFAGRRAMDGETGQVPAELASGLGMRIVTNAVKAECSEQDGERRLKIQRMTGDGEETLLVSGKCVVTFTEYSYRLRLPGLLGRRRAMKTDIRMLDLEGLGMSPDEAGRKGSLTRVLETKILSERLRKGPRTQEVEKAAQDIAEYLKEAGR